MSNPALYEIFTKLFSACQSVSQNVSTYSLTTAQKEALVNVEQNVQACQYKTDAATIKAEVQASGQVPQHSVPTQPPAEM